MSPPNGISYYGEAGYTGGEITFTAVGKNAENGFLSEIKVGDYFYRVTDDDRKQQLPYTICEKEWAKIEILSVSQKTRCLKEELEKSKVIDWLIEMYVF